jgi:hypothetical protein
MEREKHETRSTSFYCARKIADAADTAACLVPAHFRDICQRSFEDSRLSGVPFWNNQLPGVYGSL